MIARYAYLAGVVGTVLALGACEYREPTTAPSTNSAPVAPTVVSAELREPSPEEIWKKIEGCWYETSVTHTGSEGPVGGEWLGWRFRREEAENWTLSGELQTFGFGEIRFDPTVTPWRFDIIDKQSWDRDNKHAVLPGLIEFLGEELVWVSDSDWSSMKPGGAFPPGPRDFTSTKENRQIRRVLKRCEYLQTRFP